ncbi:D site-binding protein-like [Salvelinus fontinalis]|uniref:D site-binding protein-like n=1 Tax=Salvelinus fontinalis TaxID=8038 RepID=UPI0024858A04|nr:D site-binding protein-like [Salvelinus fontinalis]
MSRQLTQLLTPDLPAGASRQFGNCNQSGGSISGGHLNSMASLKSLLQHPMKGDRAIVKDCCDVKDKDRTITDMDEDSLGGGNGGCNMRTGSSGVSSSNSNGCGSGGGGGGSGGGFNQSAFLGPLLWERTLPVEGGLFQLQYMDLEEFLTENGMGGVHGQNSSSTAQIPSQSSQSAVPNQSSQCPPSSPPPCSSASSSSSSPSLIGLEVAQSNMQGGLDYGE